MRYPLSVLMTGSLCLGAILSAASAGDVMTPLDLTQIRVGGEIGTRFFKGETPCRRTAGIF